jgi:hypothetical protein
MAVASNRNAWAAEPDSDAGGGNSVAEEPPRPAAPKPALASAPAAAFGAFGVAAPVEDEPPSHPAPQRTAHRIDRSSPNVARAFAEEGVAPAAGAAPDFDAPALHDASSNTPRSGTLSGGYLAVELGTVVPKQATSERTGVDDGVGLGVRLGFEFWDQIVLGFGLHAFMMQDLRPTKALVVTCTTELGVETCDDEPRQESSSVDATGWSLEAGYQIRVRPTRDSSVGFGVLAGYLQGFGQIRRSIECEGCPEGELDAVLSGLYGSPFVRVTFGDAGVVSAITRSQWFATGDMQHLTTLGFELGAP